MKFYVKLKIIAKIIEKSLNSLIPKEIRKLFQVCSN